MRFRYQNLIADLHKYMEYTEIPKLRTPIETDPQYKLVVKLSEVNRYLAGLVASSVVFSLLRTLIAKFTSFTSSCGTSSRSASRNWNRSCRCRWTTLTLSSKIRYQKDDLVAGLTGVSFRLLGNDIETKGQNKELLGAVLQPATCIVVSVTASTTQGKPLEPAELEKIIEACNMAEEVHQERHRMHQFVEMRMTLIAPNLCRIVGAGSAALLVSQAGGLAPLSQLPSCNVLVLGKSLLSATSLI